VTRPEEPTEALPTRAVPLPAAPGDPDRTRPLTPADATVHLGAPDPGATVHLGAADPGATVHLGAADPGATVHFGAADPGATVHLGAVDEGATVHLGAADPGATTHFGAAYGGATSAYAGPGETSAYGAATSAYPGAGGSSGQGAATSAYPGGTAQARAGTGPSQPAPGGELRFGPGVPATPPAAPAWPTTGGRRPRPVWRRVVSVLSTLLTVALLVAVGFYLWQRISPLEVEGVTVAVPRPAGERCDVTVDVVATVRTNGRGGVLRYQWFRSDAAPGSLLTERVGRGQRTVTLTLKWTFSGVGATTETATVNIIEPSPVQAGTEVAYRCRRR
jgi:hypothetical protein